MTDKQIPQLDEIAAQAEQNPKAARKALRRLAPTLPDTAAMQTGLGLTYLTLDQPRDAVRAFKRAIELEPDNALARFHLGSLQSDQGLLPQAEANLKVAVETNPEDPEYVAALGFNYYRSGKSEQAIVTLEKAEALGVENEDLMIALGYLYYEKDDLEKGRDAFAHAIDLAPDRGDLYNNRGYLNILLGELDAAGEDLTACLEKDESYLRARYNLALTTWLQGDHDKAIELYNAARRQDKNDAEMQQHLSDLDEVAKYYPEDNNLKALQNKLAVAMKTGHLK